MKIIWSIYKLICNVTILIAVTNVKPRLVEIVGFCREQYAVMCSYCGYTESILLWCAVTVDTPRAVCCDVQLQWLHSLCIILKIFHTIFCSSKLRQEDNNDLADLRQSADRTLLTSAPCPTRRASVFLSVKQQVVVAAKWLVFSVRYDLKLTHHNFRPLTVKVSIGGFEGFGRLNLVRH
jgi:hypothetical protein